MAEIKFEKALERLQEIVETLEGGNIDIEKSLEYYEEGINLIKQCSSKLKKIENKIALLNEIDEDEEAQDE
ncbi:MAG: exodeoxyribonuclease VII small subunit [Candidatus Celaenobacter antarcticus]|nr:exodeoxyribonuclease VII small subunit [Candidatus Celaenobacter antarcticus]MDP8313875.1 exodeoxyribonuclease VII small subunit [Candidatus Celaenobacter antarcticus]